MEETKVSNPENAMRRAAASAAPPLVRTEPDPRAPGAAVGDRFRRPAPLGANVDEAQIQSLMDSLREPWLDVLEEYTNGQARQELAEYAAIVLRDVARNTILLTSDDLRIRRMAQENLASVRGGSIAMAGIRGVRLQQNSERAFIASIQLLERFAFHWLTGGVIPLPGGNA